MTSNPPTEALSALKLSDAEAEIDPWTSKEGTTSIVQPVLAVQNKPPPIEQPVFTPAATPLAVDENLLRDFDPLADKDEKDAHEAWAATEGHPPKLPPKEVPKLPTDSTAQVEPPSTAVPTSASAFTTTFANFARSFSRPRSPQGSGPETLPSPNLVLAFANQQGDSEQRSSSPAAAAATRPETKGKADDTQFDFQRFLDQLKTRSGEPVAKYFRSFLSHFSRRTFTVSDQVKLVQQFLAFIEPKMRECDVWKRESDEEFENSLEAMEKLVMNRIFDYTFTPQVAANGRQITTDDLERDHIISQRIRLFKWVSEEHLDIPVGENNVGFLNFAQQELLKINHYKAPRDKVICILNCCKVIFGLIRQLKKQEGADAFIPILILVVLQANPEHLISNIEYIHRFRSPSKLQGETGYYLSSLTGAVSFIETMDHASLSNISQEEFEANVEDAIQNLPPSPTITPATPRTDNEEGSDRPKTPSATPTAGEESARTLQLPTPASIAEDTKKFLQITGSLAQQTISKPLNAIGKIFTEVLDGAEEDNRRRQRPEQGEWNHPEQIQQFLGDPRTPQGRGGPAPSIQTPYKPRLRGSATPSPGTRTPEAVSELGSVPPLPPRFSGFFTPSPTGRMTPDDRSGSRSPSPRPIPPPNFAHEIVAIDDAHRTAARETVTQIFPSVEPEVIEMVLDANGGDLGRTIDALLEISSG